MLVIGLPGTDVKVEYDEAKKILHVTGLPNILDTPSVFQGRNKDGTEEVYIIWGEVT